MEFNVQERLVMVNSLPEKGNFETMKTIEALRDIFYPSEEEVEKFSIKQDGNNLSWNAEGGKGIPIKLTKAQKEFMVSTFEKLSEKEELTFQHYGVFKKLKAK